MKTATRIAIVALVILVVAAPAATAEPDPIDGGDAPEGSCITYDPDNKPPVMIDRDACIIDP